MERRLAHVAEWCWHPTTHLIKSYAGRGWIAKQRSARSPNAYDG